MTIATTNNEQKKPTTAPTHPQYDFVSDELSKIRICMQGSLSVKKAGKLLLPHPSQLAQNSQEQQARYNDFIANAEYKNDGASSKRQMLGKMRLDDMKIELHDNLEYLEQNADGDNLSLADVIKNSLGETLEVKTSFLIADFQGLSDVDLAELSLAEQNELKPAAYIKSYTRDSLTNWAFRTVNGIRQLSFLQFREIGTEFNNDSGVHNEVESYLILALDEEGNYYQQKKVYGSSGESEGERNYVTVKGKALKYIPHAIVSDEPLKAGQLPLGMGFLHPIIDVSLQRYRMSARYKETQWANIPTKWTKGWQEGDFEIFKQVNSNREHMTVGGYGINNLPNMVEMGVSSASADMEDFHWDFERYDKEVAKLGGTNESGDASNMTATESEMIAVNQNALLESLAMSAEQAIKRVIAYCGVFMGVYNADDINKALDDIIVDLPRDFAKSKLSVDEVRVLIEMRMNRAISEAEFHRQIKNGGRMIAEVEDMIAEMEGEAPAMTLPDVDEGLT